MEITKEALMAGIFGDTADTLDTQKQDKTSTTNCREVYQVDLSDIYDNENHSFKIIHNSDMDELIESIKMFGVKQPILLRENKKSKGSYECIAGHRRRYAATKANMESIPAIILKLTDEEANLLMVETNKQREEWLPMEKARSWQIEYKALKNQGKRTDLEDRASDDTSRHYVDKLTTEEKLVKITGKDLRTIQRYIKLIELIEPFQELVDNKKITVMAGYHLAFLTTENQEIIEDIIPTFGIPSQEDAEYFKTLQEEENYNIKTVSDYMTNKKKKNKPFKLTEKEIKRWFPDTYFGGADEKKKLIESLLREYFKEEENYNVY